MWLFSGMQLAAAALKGSGIFFPLLCYLDVAS